MKEYRSKNIYGDFYENAEKPLVVIIGGSRAGLPAPLSDEFLEYLKSNYNVLLLAYFGVGELPQELIDIPMEYFVNAINIVKRENKISDDKVIIIGQSKGGEAALLLTNYMKSAITIACVPSCYVFQGLITSNLLEMVKEPPKSTWTYDNKELPYIKFNFDKQSFEDVKKKKFCKCYEDSIKKNFNKDAVINIDDYKGKVLLLSAENDQYWPSKKMSDILMENSKNKNSMTHISLELEGHYFLKYDESVEEIINFLNKNMKL